VKELGQLEQLRFHGVAWFRTPLGIIQSSAEILADYLDQLDPEDRRTTIPLPGTRVAWRT
jgi:hypothetical protein